MAEDKADQQPQRAVPGILTMARLGFVAGVEALLHARLRYYLLWMLFAAPVFVLAASMEQLRSGGLFLTLFLIISACFYAVPLCRHILRHRASPFAETSAIKSGVEVSLAVLALALLSFILAICLVAAPLLREMSGAEVVQYVVTSLPVFGDIVSVGLYGSFHVALETGISGVPVLISNPVVLADLRGLFTSIAEWPGFYAAMPVFVQVIYFILVTLIVTAFVFPFVLMIPAAALGHGWIGGAESTVLLTGVFWRSLAALFVVLMPVLALIMLCGIAFSGLVLDLFLTRLLGYGENLLLLYTSSQILVVSAYALLWHFFIATLAVIYRIAMVGQRVAVIVPEAGRP